MNTDKNKKTEEILSSLDGLKKATAPDFFYTRLKARMEKETLPVDPKPGRVLRPVFALTALVAVLLINAAVIFTKSNAGETISVNEGETLQSIAADYNLNDVSSIYDLNEDK
ncbi:MAG: LysM peptidoglycan-binding domain-containing protein [Bacteroidota bacterium]